jgi:hypothetical protein
VTTQPASYDALIAARSSVRAFDGLAVTDSDRGPNLFDFQWDLDRWALTRGRAAIFADTGLGKTRMELTWAARVAREGRVLILAPLAVADQTVREGERIGIPVAYLREDDPSQRIVITNYEMVGHFDPAGFAGIVLDESSILKAFDGATRNQLIGMFADTPYRLACTATPAPNDFTELGNHSEFLGALSRVEMLSEFFTHDGGSTQDWRLKGHAREAFWRWVASWGAVVRTPAALGYPDDAYRLPPMELVDHVIPVDHSDAWAAGALFVADARTLNEQRGIRRATMERRCQLIADLVNAEPAEPWLVWCELNDEGDLLERLLRATQGGCVQVKGADSPDEKRDGLLGFTDGRHRVLVSKVSIAGFGMNWQHCARMAFVGPSHSYEGTYQAIRRCWRFGQTRPVQVHVVCAENERAIVQNLRRKEADADRLAEETQRHIGPAMREAIGATERRWNPYHPTVSMEIPPWLT